MTSRGRALDALAGFLRLTPGNRPLPANTDWAAVIGLANEHLLGPILLARLRKNGVLRTVPAEVRDYLTMLYGLNRLRNIELRRQAREIIAALNSAGIHPLLLKGALTLLDRPCPDQDRASRMMCDLDFLVPRPDLERAVAALEALGYAVFNLYPAAHHAYAEFSRAGEPATVDLHTELVDPSYLLPATETWRRAVSLPGLEGAAGALSPTDRLLHHLLHAQVHYLSCFHRGELKLSQVYELAAWTAWHEQGIDWRFIERRMADWGLGTPLQSYLIAANRLFGLEWPLSVKPTWAGRLHFWRCRLQIRIPWLASIMRPLGNLRGAFAGYRMRALYGSERLLILSQLRHAWRFLRKMPVRAVWSRVLRA